MGQSRPLIVYSCYFLDTISISEKSVDGVLEIRTRSRKMVGTDETTELWRPPLVIDLKRICIFYFCSLSRALFRFVKDAANRLDVSRAAASPTHVLGESSLPR